MVDKNQPLNLSSKPEGANVKVYDYSLKAQKETNELLFSGVTPTQVMLTPNDHKGDVYKVKFSKKGYENYEQIVGVQPSNWTWGNVPFLYLGLVGILVDGVSGTDVLSEDAVVADLIKDEPVKVKK
jgi:hypothetical protein